MTSSGTKKFGSNVTGVDETKAEGKTIERGEMVGPGGGSGSLGVTLGLFIPVMRFVTS